MAPKPKSQAIIVAPPKDVVVVTPARAQKKKKKSKSKKTGGARRMTSLADMYFYRVSCPDLFGPFRQPRFGAADRTGLGMDRTRYTITGSGTNVVQVVQMGSIFNGSPLAVWTATSESASFTVASGPSLGSQFPPSAQIADINFVAGSLVVSYTGQVTSAQGEILTGSVIPISTSSSYSALYYYPGTTAMPVASLIETPLRSCMRKLSAASDEFVSTGTGSADVDLPFVAVSGLSTGTTLVVECTRVWEYRSTTVAGSVIPYEKQGGSLMEDTFSWQEALGRLSSMVSPVMEAVPSFARDVVGRMAGMVYPHLTNMTAQSIVSGLGSRAYAEHARTRNQLRLEL